MNNSHRLFEVEIEFKIYPSVGNTYTIKIFVPIRLQEDEESINNYIENFIEENLKNVEAWKKI